MREYPEAGPVRTYRLGNRPYVPGLVPDARPVSVKSPITEADGKRIIHPGDTLKWWHSQGPGVDVPEPVKSGWTWGVSENEAEAE